MRNPEDTKYVWDKKNFNIIQKNIMKKNKTTKPLKKSYSSVKELIKDNNSKVKLTPFNCKEARFGKLITMSNPQGLSGKFDVIFRRASTSQRFFEDMENQISNQILWNEEEQQAYFLNSERQLYKILFEPIYMKKKNTDQTTEEYMESLRKNYLKKEIQEIAIPWSKFLYKSPFVDKLEFKQYLLEPLFIDLLDAVKEKKIKIKCGVGIMSLINRYFYVESLTNAFKVGGCEIVTELDFTLPKYDIEYEDISILGIGVPEKDTDIAQDANELFKEVADKVCPPKKKRSFWQRIFG